MSVNKAIIVGRLGDDPEMRDAGGTPVASMSIATDESYTDGSGNEVDQTEWHDVVAFGRTAEVCERYLSKGSQVYVEGTLQTSEYTDSDGVDRYSTEIKALSVQFLETPDAGGDGAMHQNDPAPEPTSQERTSDDQDDTFEPDDRLPF